MHRVSYGSCYLHVTANHVGSRGCRKGRRYGKLHSTVQEFIDFGISLYYTIVHNGLTARRIYAPFCRCLLEECRARRDHETGLTCRLCRPCLLYDNSAIFAQTKRSLRKEQTNYYGGQSTCFPGTSQFFLSSETGPRLRPRSFVKFKNPLARFISALLLWKPQ